MWRRNLNTLQSMEKERKETFIKTDGREPSISIDVSEELKTLLVPCQVRISSPWEACKVPDDHNLLLWPQPLEGLGRKQRVAPGCFSLDFLQ